MLFSASGKTDKLKGTVLSRVDWEWNGSVTKHFVIFSAAPATFKIDLHLTPAAKVNSRT